MEEVDKAEFSAFGGLTDSNSPVQKTLIGSQALLQIRVRRAVKYATQRDQVYFHRLVRQRAVLVILSLCQHGAFAKVLTPMTSALRLDEAAHRYNETLNQDGSQLPSWGSLLSHIERFSPDQLERRQRDIDRLLRANRLAYRPESSAVDARQMWGTLDLIPMLFDDSDWRSLSSGLNQQARLRQALYRDIYGEQRLIGEGVLPPEMLYAHKGFVRALVDSQTGIEHSRVLPMVSFEIARTLSGQWTLIDSFCQSPTGIGYALENRLVLSRVLPGSFRNFQVNRIVSYFRELQQHILNASRSTSRCVLLGYPASHPNYFECAWLAKYLGYTLIQPADLTVRDDHVYLKTVSGLQLVESILRFVDDDDIDPLVHGNSNHSGVPGLFEAARQGTVTIFNPLGAGVLDNPAFNTILPELCRSVLGEELELQATETYWLGDADQRNHVFENIDHLLLRHIDSEAQVVSPALLNDSEKQTLIDQISLSPVSYVAQRPVERSVVPKLEASKQVFCEATVRTFLISSGDGYQMMPGALCLLDSVDRGRESLHDGSAGTKDVWVMLKESLHTDSLLVSAKEDAAYAMLEGELPSRIAESMFWLGRNAERVECTLRLLRSILQSLLDEEIVPDTGTTSVALEGLLRAITASTGTSPGFSGRGSKRRLMQPDRELVSLLQDASRLGTLANALKQWQMNASDLSERLSGEQLSVFNRLAELEATLLALDLPGNLCTDIDAMSQTQIVLEDLLLVASAFTGLCHENVTHGDGWHFLMLGRRIERAYQLAATVGAMLSVSRDDHRLLEYLLRLFDSVMTYRSRYRSGLNNQLVLQLLLLDEINPRSLGYQFHAIEQLMSALPGRRTTRSVDNLGRLATAGLSRVRLADPENLITSEKDARQSLQRFLRVLQELPLSMADAITANYFTHTEAVQKIGSFGLSASGAVTNVNDAEVRNIP